MPDARPRAIARGQRQPHDFAGDARQVDAILIRAEQSTDEARVACARADLDVTRAGDFADEMRALGNRDVPGDSRHARRARVHRPSHRTSRCRADSRRRTDATRRRESTRTRPSTLLCRSSETRPRSRQAAAAWRDIERDHLPATLERTFAPARPLIRIDQRLLVVGSVHARRDLRRRGLLGNDRNVERRDGIRECGALAIDLRAHVPARDGNAEMRVAREARVRRIEDELATDRAMRGVPVVDELPRGVLGTNRFDGCIDDRPRPVVRHEQQARFRASATTCLCKRSHRGRARITTASLRTSRMPRTLASSEPVPGRANARRRDVLPAANAWGTVLSTMVRRLLAGSADVVALTPRRAPPLQRSAPQTSSRRALLDRA